MILILLGAPGAGKGTQAERIINDFSIPSISTGDLLRAEVKNESELGKSAKAFMDKGELVPDDLIVSMLKKRVEMDDCANGYILDGFPRNVEQAKILKEMLAGMNRSLNNVVSVDVDPESIVERLSNRLTCSNCKAGYNRISKKPKEEGKCDLCGGDLFQRDDDKEDTIRNRLKVYAQQTEPLKAFYNEESLLFQVDGNRDIDAVYNDIKVHLQNIAS